MSFLKRTSLPNSLSGVSICIHPCLGPGRSRAEPPSLSSLVSIPTLYLPPSGSRFPQKNGPSISRPPSSLLPVSDPRKRPHCVTSQANPDLIEDGKRDSMDKGT